MKEVKELGTLKVITFDGYKFVCFENTTDTKLAKSIGEEYELDGAILANRIHPVENLGYTLHFIAIKNINVKRLVEMLVTEGKANDLYWKHNGVNTMKSAWVHSANLNLIK